MMGIPMRRLLAVGCLFLALAVIPPNAANATCGEECDLQYSSDVDDCHSNFGDDPADAGDLAICIRDARDDYRSCVSNCAAQMVFSSPRGPVQIPNAGRAWLLFREHAMRL
jgi:hypothetical protein